MKFEEIDIKPEPSKTIIKKRGRKKGTKKGAPKSSNKPRRFPSYKEGLYLNQADVKLAREIKITFYPTNKFGLRVSKCGRFAIETQHIFAKRYTQDNVPVEVETHSFYVFTPALDMNSIHRDKVSPIFPSVAYFGLRLIEIENEVVRIVRKEYGMREQEEKDRKFETLKTFISEKIEREWNEQTVPDYPEYLKQELIEDTNKLLENSSKIIKKLKEEKRNKKSEPRWASFESF